MTTSHARGEVGPHRGTVLLPVGDQVVQVPLTYRDAPLEQGTLVGEMEHSALGRRWIHDGPSDPVYVAETTGELTVARLVPGEVPADATATLTGTWQGRDEPVVLAWLS